MEEGSKASRQTVALGSAGKAPWLPTRREFPSPYPFFFFFFLSLKAGVVLDSISGEILFTFQVVVVIIVLALLCGAQAPCCSTWPSLVAEHRP